MSALFEATAEETDVSRGGPLSRARVACFIPDMTDGGAQRAVVKLIGGIAARGLAVDLVLVNSEGPHLGAVDARARVVDLAAGRVARVIPKLARYLSRERPHALVSFLSHANVAALASRALARSGARVAVVEQNTVSAVRSGLRRDGLLPALVRRTYPRADAVVAVSEGVARDLVSRLGVPPGKVHVIPNPVVDEALLRAATAPAGHPWFGDDGAPVFLAVGRLTAQKDFPTLLRAFRMLRQSRAARLMILGEGEARAELEAMTDEMSLTDDVALPGFVENPYARMSRAAAFVLSSRWEGLPTVLIEALACGCPVVATDCPSGPREILEGGAYGALVPVGDAAAMRDAMARALDAPPRAAALRGRAALYSVGRAVDQYLELIGLARA
ncbi:MAG: glycosyltransferase [Acidobacteria bacterium]|nr:glycosyltransferase [Acidobacteriota bacterium]